MPVASHILFPVDFSPSSAALVPAVAAMARRLRLPVTLLHAGKEKEDRLASFGGDSFRDLAVHREVTELAPAESIVRRATSLVHPLIMMPTRGTTAFRQLFIGSVTASVLQAAECPVWTSAHCADGGPLPEDYRSVVCAIDFGPRSLSVLSWAREFSDEFGATLHVVHSVPGIDPRFESGAANRAHSFLVDVARQDYPALAESARVNQPLEIVEEIELAGGITGAVKRHGADALIIGRGVMQGVLGRLRTNAHDLIRQSPCPVLSV